MSPTFAWKTGVDQIAVFAVQALHLYTASTISCRQCGICMTYFDSAREVSFETVFVDENPEVINALATSFGRMYVGKVRFMVGNVFGGGPGVLVSPTNSFGDLSGGLDLQLAEMFSSLQDRLQTFISRQTSKRLPIGAVVWVETESKSHPFIIFSPTFRAALDMATSPNRIYRAALGVFSSLLAYNGSGTTFPVTRVLMPGFGTGLGQMDPTLAGRKVFEAYKRSLDGKRADPASPVILHK